MYLSKEYWLSIHQVEHQEWYLTPEMVFHIPSQSTKDMRFHTPFNVFIWLDVT